MAAPSGVTADLREAAEAMRHDESGGVFLYAVAALLENKAVQIDKHLPRVVSPATPERVWADVFKVARAYLQEVETTPESGECTCGHYYSDHPCARACGCSR